uniref:Uncharacterized protein n=1 Tax=Rhizophora mucronata TaxID=61149 RepID=A0A2P2KK15_RHIMU
MIKYVRRTATRLVNNQTKNYSWNLCQSRAFVAKGKFHKVTAKEIEYGHFNMKHTPTASVKIIVTISSSFHIVVHYGLISINLA